MYTYVKTYQIIYFTYVQFIVRQLYLRKVKFFLKEIRHGGQKILSFTLGHRAR